VGLVNYQQGVFRHGEIGALRLDPRNTVAVDQVAVGERQRPLRAGDGPW